MLKGDKVYLCSVSDTNLEQLRTWRNRPDLRKYFREYEEISEEKQQKWFAKTNSDKNQVNFEIHDQQTNKLIGDCGLYHIHWAYSTAEFGIFLGDDDYRSKGCGSDALRILIRYGFDNLNLNRIWCEVYDNNPSIELYKYLGFQYEGTMKEHYYDDGRYWDSHLLGMLKSDYLLSCLNKDDKIK